MMISKVTSATISLALVISLSATTAYAKKVEEKRDLPSFTKISANGSSDVTIKVGPKQSVVVKAEDKEVGEIKTEVKGDELVIWRKSKRGGFMSHSAHIYVTVPKLEALSSRGSGDAYLSGLKADGFKLTQQGSGDVDFEGSCKTGRIVAQGSGDLESDRFQCDEVDIDLQGSGDMEIDDFRTKTVKLDAMGSGDIAFAGKCDDFSLKHMASGDVDAHNLKCKTVSVRAKGSGDMRVFATEDVKVRINGSGDVEIYGGGGMSELNVSGSGSVRTRK